MTIFFTSDLHLDHKNIIRLSKRPFSSVEEMNEEIIRRHNTIVGENDTVYDLGDRYFGNPKKYDGRFNGKLIRIKGSHDHDIKEPRMIVLNLENDISITLCHYAMRSWERSHYATWHLFGHHHGALEPYGLSFDIGVDCWDFYPVSLEMVARKMATLKPIVDYRKK